MRIFIFIFVVLVTFASCSKSDKIVDKTKLSPADYRLFQETSVWPLAKAAIDEDMVRIKELMDNNPNLANIRDSIYGNTILMMSIINQDFDLFELLINRGANINFHNLQGGVSPLIEACSFREYDSKFAEELIRKGANVNDTAQNAPSVQTTPLMAAARCGNVSVVRILIRCGANVNYRNNFGSTVLGESMLTRKYDVALILLNHGAHFLSPIYNDLDEYGKSTIPVTLPVALRKSMVEIGTIEHYQKREIINFLKKRGVDYDTIPIPDYVIIRAKKKYPSSWQDYLRHY